MTRPLNEERQQVKYAHFKTETGFMTVAGLKKEGFYFYGVALCSPEDNFSRKIGREFAFKKLYQQAKYCSGALPGKLFNLNERNSDLAKTAVLNTLDELHTRPVDKEDRWYDMIETNEIKLNSKKIRRKLKVENQEETNVQAN